MLSISAAWCHWCHVMDETTYSDPEVIELINRDYIPIRVDNDQRPDINRRYNQGGWPSTVFISDQGVSLAGGTYIPPEQMRLILRKLPPLYRERSEEIRQRAEEIMNLRQNLLSSQFRGAGLPKDARDRVWREIESRIDWQYGGLGSAPKFPETETLHLALDIYLEEGGEYKLRWAESTLQHMVEGGIYDQVEGGFFRYSTTRDWSIPHYEKMLSDNAQLSALLLRLYLITSSKIYAIKARETLNYIIDNLSDGMGHFFGSQDADEHYYTMHAEARRKLAKPLVDDVSYVDSTALAAEALLLSGDILGDEIFSDMARASLKALSLEMYSEQQGMPHYLQNGQPHYLGFLEDQASALRVFIKGYQHFGDESLLEKAVKLATLIEKHYWESERGILFEMDERMQPAIIIRGPAELGIASATANSLTQLGCVTGEDKYISFSAEILETFYDSYSRYSYHAASYAAAVNYLLNPIKSVTLTGNPRSPGYRELRRVVFLSPSRSLCLKFEGNNDSYAGGRQDEEKSQAIFCQGSECILATSDPGELAEALGIKELKEKEGG